MELFILALVLIFIIIGGLIIFKLLANQGERTEKPLPYRAKQYFFSRSEQEFLRILNESIDRQKYIIFPKVRLADFIEVTIKGKEYQGWWNKIKSKHVDFLVWDLQLNKIIAAIELDGKTHELEQVKKRDEFIEKLYKYINLPLFRVKVGSSFTNEIQEMIKTSPFIKS